MDRSSPTRVELARVEGRLGVGSLLRSDEPKEGQSSYRLILLVAFALGVLTAILLIMLVLGLPLAQVSN
jgi:hypothetical protein